MDNAGIARLFAEIGDLLEIKGENPFKIRAYRNAAEVIVGQAAAIAELDDAALLQVQGIGRDLAKKIREIVETGGCAYHRDLLAEFPASILELLRLQGIGPKTVRQLHAELGIASIDALEAALRDGRVRQLKGMGARKAETMLKAIEERKRHAGRHLLADAADAAAGLTAFLRAREPKAEFTPVGSLRRGCETCGDLDILAIDASAAVMDHLTTYPGVSRVLARGETKSSVLLQAGLQADLRLVPRESRGAALQYFTGSKQHNVVLRDRAIGLGLKLNEYGLYRVADGARVAGATEEDLYEALGLAWVPPELREHRGEVEAAASGALPVLVTRDDLRGDLHVHTTATDGRDDLETMARAAREAGLDYLAITDHSQALAMANGLDERRALDHARRIRELDSRLDGLRLLAGIECDIRLDGSLDLADDCLAQLDYVVASVHSGFGQDAQQMTDRLLRAIECPWVDTIGHPTGRILLRREPHQARLETVVDAAARAGVALEVNCQVDRLDLGDAQARLARERGVKLVIASDAHARTAFATLRWGVGIARRAWASPGDVLNTLPYPQLVAALRRNRGTIAQGT